MSGALPLSGAGYRIRGGQFIGVIIKCSSALTGGDVEGTFVVRYDDGSYGQLIIAPVALSLGDFNGVSSAALSDGTIVSGFLFTNGGPADVEGAVYAKVLIVDSQGPPLVNVSRQMIAKGYLTADDDVTLGQFRELDFRGTYAFQGTVAEDATGGTHVCTLTVTPGAGNSIEVVGGSIQVGNTATAQGPSAFVDDGTNILFHLLNPDGTTETNASAVYEIPTGSQLLSNLTSSSQSPGASWGAFKISGSMRLILKVSTAAVSVTQTFGLVCRLKGTELPTATLNDTIGSSTNTINTNALF